MTTKIFIGKLSYTTNKTTLTNLFAQYGDVASVAIITDRTTGQSKGFAFVEMNDPKTAQLAIKELNGREVDGRMIAVNAAKEREDIPRHQVGHQRSW